jgi:hypothetical protein
VFGVHGSGFTVKGIVYMVQSLGFMVKGLVFRV